MSIANLLIFHKKHKTQSLDWVGHAFLHAIIFSSVIQILACRQNLLRHQQGKKFALSSCRQ